MKYEYEATVVKIIDGDTVDLAVDLGFHITLTDRFRLYGINTPETNTKEGKIAKAVVERLSPVGSIVKIKTHKDKRGKYGRWLATIIHNRVNVNKYLLRYGYATEY